MSRVHTSVETMKMNISKNSTEPTDMRSIHLPMNLGIGKERYEILMMPEPVAP